MGLKALGPERTGYKHYDLWGGYVIGVPALILGVSSLVMGVNPNPPELPWIVPTAEGQVHDIANKAACDPIERESGAGGTLQHMVRFTVREAFRWRQEDCAVGSTNPGSWGDDRFEQDGFENGMGSISVGVVLDFSDVPAPYGEDMPSEPTVVLPRAA